MLVAPSRRVVGERFCPHVENTPVAAVGNLPRHPEFLASVKFEANQSPQERGLREDVFRDGHEHWHNYWVGTGHLLIALAADRHRKGSVTGNDGDPGYGDGLAALDEIAPDWEEEVGERLRKVWAELEAVVERLRREQESSGSS